ncbi:hypothetical protein SAMN06269185_0741 [Natronoarchaeum philippinense]|uniref:Uncharacterized protein n=1 Tax=Natronoarchaeum philippinense TaxID=558529 RepID=A0A285N7X2_NATPI|nr:hypothetical protein [Natronoarchaeum philippinense]SNZ04977.1 hypothetical protein SAMN06269185_0741 [Natronoarchaeum philippinense]
MSAAGRVLVAVGTVTAVLGLALLVEPGLASEVFADQFYVSLVGVLAVLQGGRYARDAWRSPVVGAETGDPELVEGVPTPGDGFDAALDSASDVHTIDGRSEIRERLGGIASVVLERRRDCSPEQAREQLAAGDWTDDPLAAAFFSDNADIPLSIRLRIRVSSKSPFGVRAEHAADELERIWRAES